MRLSRNPFANERSFYSLLAVIAGVVAILKGLRGPYHWAATQAQIDYRNGFLRRGLFGEICRRLHLPIWHFSVFAAVSFTILAATLALLFFSFRRSSLDAASNGAITALVAGSFCVSFLTNLVGFYDVLMLLLVLLLLQVRGPVVQLIACLACAILGILLHELYAVAFLPVSLLASVRWAASQWRRWLAVGLVALIPCIVLVAIIHRPQLTAVQDAALRDDVRARVDFLTDDNVLLMLQGSMSANRDLMRSMMHAGEWWVEEAFGMMAFLPITTFFVVLAWRMASGRWTRVWILGSTVSPLLLNFVAFDRYRWLLMMALNAMLCALVAAKGQRLQLSIAWSRAAILLLALNLATDVGFFLDRANSYPFQSLWLEHRPTHRGPEAVK